MCLMLSLNMQSLNIDHSKSLEGVSLTEITGLEDIVVFSFSKLDFVIVRV